MKVLVVGGGGREHALVWKLAQSPAVERVYCAPGNAGIALDATCVDVAANDMAKLADLAQELKIGFTVVGPEAPLVKGIVDHFHERGLAIVGPVAAAARLEGSKVFAKQFMKRYGIPTATAWTAESSNEAWSFLCSFDYPMVIKADGLAAGKGVRICQTNDEAIETIEQYFEKRILGEAGARIVLEECLEGEELSFIVLTDGERVLPLAPTQDHKRVFDNDEGPNTGGMGAYSDDALIPPALHEQIMEKIVRPTIRGMAADGAPYTGFLYFGLMLTKKGPMVLEYNCRMGDPEAQPIVMRMNSDFAESLRAAASPDGLKGVQLEWSNEAAVCVVLAAKGYPGEYETGRTITGLEDAGQIEDVRVFHAGTCPGAGGEFVTAGGRVLGVTARGTNLQAAVGLAYEAAGKIHFEGIHYRKDIGARLLRKLAAKDDI